jgi:6,7-dimethyl-8-ribityllumazine synthase
MAKTNPDRPRDAQPAGTYAIVASEYNRAYVDGLLQHCEAEISAVAPGSTVVIHRVPGAFEAPLAVQEIAKRGGIDAVIAFGVIIAGATAHADLIASAITDALMQIGLSTGVPVIHEVLLVRDEAQARERCLGTAINRGAEAARAAIGMAGALRGIRA